jgi:hypothetical protein
MVDAGTGLTILGTAIGSAKLVEKVLGPTAEYIGTGLQSWTARRCENVRKIFEHADKVLGDDSNPNDAVHPRVLNDVLSDGSFRDDAVSTAYYGAVLASSKSGVSRDDRGAGFSALIGRLSSYQLRTHFILYSAVRSIYQGRGVNLQVPQGRKGCQTYISYVEFIRAFELTKGEDFYQLLPHAVFGLQKESLIADEFAFGGVEEMKRRFQHAPDGGLIFQPSALGAELLMWATGNAKLGINGIFAPGLPVQDLDIPACPAACNPKEVDDAFRAVAASTGQVQTP